MELKQYAGILFKWLWLIVLGTILSAGIVYVISRNMTPVYQASTMLMVSPKSNSSTSTYENIISGQQLAKTYSELLKRRSVLELAIQALDLQMTPEQLSRVEEVQTLRDTQLIVVRIENEDPNLAARLANQIAHAFIEENQTAQLGLFASSKENLSKQLKQLEEEMTGSQASLDKARAASNSSEITRLETSISQARSSYSSLLQTYEEIRIEEAKSLGNLVIAEPAEVPNIPVRPNIVLNTGLAAVIGIILTVGLAILIEFLDDRIHTSQQVTAMLDLPTLGRIPRAPARNHADRLVVQTDPRSPVAEAYRILRTNVQFANVDKPPKTILVTSAGPLEGKSTAAANLASAMAQGGLSVALIDTDLRRPILHDIFHVPNDYGLTTSLLQTSDELNGCIQMTKVENLRILPSGPIPPNPSELLGSERMHRLIDLLEQKFDLVIFDSPPVLAVADAAVLAPHVDGVIFVLDAGNTRREPAQSAVETIAQVGGPILGVVLNKLSAKHYGYYYHYSRDRNKHRSRFLHKSEVLQVDGSNK